MINKYLAYLQEEKEENLNEFIVLPIILLIAKAVKANAEHRKIAKHCIGYLGVERKKCFLKYKIQALEKTISESSNFKATCKKYAKNVPKCIKKVDREMQKLSNEIKTLKTKLAKL